MATSTTTASAGGLQRAGHGPAAAAAATQPRMARLATSLPGRGPCCCRPGLRLAGGPQQQQQQQRGSSTTRALPLAGMALAAGAAWLLSRQEDQEAVEQDRFEASSRRPCPSCSGTGYQACACVRWSDGDVGCTSCSGTPGYTRCRSCGGGGMATPIRVTIPSRHSSGGGGGGGL